MKTAGYWCLYEQYLRLWGATVSWDAGTSTATAVRGSTTVVLKIGSPSPTINGITKSIDVPGKIVSGRTLAPLRFVCEAFGGTVSWNANACTAIITDTSALDEKVAEILANNIKPDMSDVQKEYAIFDYIVKNTAYDYKNYKKGTVPLVDGSAYGVLVNKLGVCEGYAEAVKLLMKKVGIECRIVSGNADDGSADWRNEWGNHAWNIVKIDGNYYHVDATWGYNYFNVTDEKLSIDHEWYRKDYPACTTKNGLSDAFENSLFIAGGYVYTFAIESDVAQDPFVLYRTKIDSNPQKEAVYRAPFIPESFCCDGDWIYCALGSQGGNGGSYVIWKMKLDGSEKSIAVDGIPGAKVGHVCDVNFYNGCFYVAIDEKIYKSDTTAANWQVIFTASTGSLINITSFKDDWVYYSIDSEKYKIKIDGTGNTAL